MNKDYISEDTCKLLVRLREGINRIADIGADYKTIEECKKIIDGIIGSPREEILWVIEQCDDECKEDKHGHVGNGVFFGGMIQSKGKEKPYWTKNIEEAETYSSQENGWPTSIALDRLGPHSVVNEKYECEQWLKKQEQLSS